MSIPNLIQKYYDIIMTGDAVTDMSQVKEIYFANIYGDCETGYEKINTLFLNQIAKKEDAVLLAGIKQNQVVFKDEFGAPIWLTSSPKLMGWDIGSARDIYGDKHLHELLELTNKTQVLSKKIEECRSESDKKILKNKLKLIVAQIPRVAAEITTQGEAQKEKLASVFAKRINSLISTTKNQTNKHRKVFVMAPREFFVRTNMDLRFKMKKMADFVLSRNAIVIAPKHELAKAEAEDLEKKLNDLVAKISDEEDSHTTELETDSPGNSEEKVALISRRISKPRLVPDSVSSDSDEVEKLPSSDFSDDESAADKPPRRLSSPNLQKKVDTEADSDEESTNELIVFGGVTHFLNKAPTSIYDKPRATR